MCCYYFNLFSPAVKPSRSIRSNIFFFRKKSKEGKISQKKGPENYSVGQLGQDKSNGEVRFGHCGHMKAKKDSKNSPETF